MALAVSVGYSRAHQVLRAARAASSPVTASSYSCIHSTLATARASASFEIADSILTGLCAVWRHSA
jgi:hypothetical protein